MQLIKLTKDIEHEGLSAGDVLSVDERSAAHLIKVGEAEEFEPETVEKVETIDDIPSTAKRVGAPAVMSAIRVGSADPGPVVAVQPETPTLPVKKADTKPASAASGAQPAGGDAGGGDTS